MKFRLIVVTLVGMALAVAGGCGTKGPKLVKVSGTVKFKDGTTIPVPDKQKGRPPAITFNLANPGAESAAGQVRKGASGEIKADGSFEMTTELGTYNPGNGVIPGKYIATITAFSKYGDPKSSLVPQKYMAASTSDLKVDVENKAISDLKLELDNMK